MSTVQQLNKLVLEGKLEKSNNTVHLMPHFKAHLIMEFHGKEEIKSTKSNQRTKSKGRETLTPLGGSLSKLSHFGQFFIHI